MSGSGNLFVTGTFSWDMQVDGIGLRDPLHRGPDTNAQSTELFVLELDASGQTKWAHGVMGAKNDTVGLFGLCRRDLPYTPGLRPCGSAR